MNNLENYGSCELCNMAENWSIIVDGLNFYRDKNFDEMGVMARKDNAEMFYFNYCPMCGRKLR